MQVTGATSSYAKKYALGSMFLLDDSKDSDSQDNSQPVEVKKEVISAAALKKVNTLLTLKNVDRTTMHTHYKVESLKDLPLNAVQGLIEYLEKL